jgi:predicted DNA-binding transcriptional regulator YafY
MPRKKDYDRSYGQKLITLFTRLLFSGDSYSLTELSRMLDCSKQTILRLIDDITLSYDLPLMEEKRGNRKYYYMQRPRGIFKTTSLSEEELQVLQMCQVFTAHLLGPDLFEEAARALWKSQALLPEERKISSRTFASYRPGSIDYTAHQEDLRRLIEAITKSRVCRITYQAIMEKKAKIFYIKPLKIFSHQDTIYLHARLAKTPGKPYKEPDFDPLLALHRIKRVEMTERSFEFPQDYDFEKVFNRHFGIIKEEVFKVTVEFSGWSAWYVSERVWSPDQKIVRKGKDKIHLTFSASSEPELVSWLLSFGEEAKLLKPNWLVKEVALKVESIYGFYQKRGSDKLAKK